ncbi:unnamed protein product [Cuscuta europaea]|uniref:Uncharacterized protein n=1 Tax=Cuscuta europaea TaxID=41803 RepID=A0A9P0YMM6_CUSEU|nr:unnamed protein product [Cuscuta europaea]
MHYLMINKHTRIELNMNRVAVAVALLFFTLSPSQGRIQIRKPKYGVSIHQFSNPFPEHDVTSVLRLPSDSLKENEMLAQPDKVAQQNQPVENQPESKAEAERRPIEHSSVSNGPMDKPVEAHPESTITVENDQKIEHQPETKKDENGPVEQHSNSNEAVEAQPHEHKEPTIGGPELNDNEAQPKTNNEKVRPVEPETKDAAVEGMSFNRAGFRPINRQFRLKSGIPYRLCRHNHLHHIEEIIPDESHVKIPFGDGMTLSFAGNGDFSQEVFHGGRVHPNMFPFGNHHHQHHDFNEGMVSNRQSENEDGSSSHVTPKWVKFLPHLHHNHGPHHLHQHEDKIAKSSPENGHDTNSENFNRGSGDGGEKAEEAERHDSEKKESYIQKQFRKMLNQYF